MEDSLAIGNDLSLKYMKYDKPKCTGHQSSVQRSCEHVAISFKTHYMLPVCSLKEKHLTMKSFLKPNFYISDGWYWATVVHKIQVSKRTAKTIYSHLSQDSHNERGKGIQRKTYVFSFIFFFSPFLIIMFRKCQIHEENLLNTWAFDWCFFLDGNTERTIVLCY